MICCSFNTRNNTTNPPYNHINLNPCLTCFNKLINHGEQHLFDHVKIDYFAVSLPDLLIWEDDLNLRNQIHCNLVMGLGYLGLNDRKTAERFLGKVRELDINHQGLNVL